MKFEPHTWLADDKRFVIHKSLSGGFALIVKHSENSEQYISAESLDDAVKKAKEIAAKGEVS